MTKECDSYERALLEYGVGLFYRKSHGRIMAFVGVRSMHFVFTRRIERGCDY